MVLIMTPVLCPISVYSDQTFLPLRYKANTIVFAAFKWARAVLVSHSMAAWLAEQDMSTAQKAKTGGSPQNKSKTGP